MGGCGRSDIVYSYSEEVGDGELENEEGESNGRSEVGEKKGEEDHFRSDKFLRYARVAEYVKSDPTLLLTKRYASLFVQHCCIRTPHTHTQHAKSYRSIVR